MNEAGFYSLHDDVVLQFTSASSRSFALRSLRPSKNREAGRPQMLLAQEFGALQVVRLRRHGYSLKSSVFV